ncbi:MAG: FtsX-like permease family protein [Nitrososphaerota archaeon]
MELLALAFRSVIADIRRSMLYILTIGFLLMTISAPLVIANGYAENFGIILPKYEQSRFFLINASATSLSWSTVDYSITEQLAVVGFKDLFPQILLYSYVAVGDNFFEIRIRGVDRLDEYFRHNGFRVNGNIPSSSSDVAIGILVARRFNVEKGAFLRIFLDNGNYRDFRISGIIDCGCPSDEEVLMQLSGVWDIRPDNLGKVSFIEVMELEKANLSALYSLGLKVFDERPFYQAAYDLISKTLNSIRNWSAPLHLLVLAAVYFTSMRIIRESMRDGVILRCIGATRRKVFSYLLYRCLIVTMLGIFVGLAFGVTSAQVAFRLISIVLSTGSYNPPSLDFLDIIRLMALSLLSSIAGILYPLFKEMKKQLGDLAWQLTYP